MITRQEAIRIMQVLESDDVYYDERAEEYKKMFKYITQQEKKDKLLELYKEKDVILENINKCFNDLIQRELLLDKYKYKEKLIKALEEELK